MHPTNGLTFDISGGLGPDRLNPVFKIRQWRSLDDAVPAMLEGVGLTPGVDFRSVVKPISRAFFGEILWSSTLEDAGAVTSPEVGSAGTVNGVAFVEGKHGRGASFSPGTDISFVSHRELR